MRNKIIILSILGYVVCSAFKKPIIVLTDSRDAYIGTYFCKQVCYTRSAMHNQSPNIIEHTIRVVITKDVEDSILQINFENQIAKVKLLGKALITCPASRQYGGNFFATDSVYFHFAAGRATTCAYKGKKQ